MQPYTYYIYHMPTAQHYYGVRYSKHYNPSDLWVTYFTSSKKVKALIKEYGKDSFYTEIRKVFNNKNDAMLFEARVLRKLDVLNKSNWLNCNISGVIHNVKGNPFKEGNIPWNKGIPMSEETKQKMLNTRKRNGTNVSKNLPVMKGDLNPMKNPVHVNKLRTTVTGRRRKYRDDGTWYWFRESEPVLLQGGAHTP